MNNYKLIVEYDGRDFCGWQIQPNLRTIQGVMEKALLEITGRKTKIICGGRTDSGVHAFGQCANFKSTIDWGTESIRKALNRALPDDITVHSCEVAEMDFHARFSALERRYQYLVYNGRSSIHRDFCWRYLEKINFACLRRLAAIIPGEHDFGSFCVKKSQKNSNLCTVTKSYWTKKGKKYTFHISSNRFLHGMVRGLVGTMLKVSAKFLKEEDFEDLIASPERSKKVFTAPPDGLYLMEIVY